MKKLILPLVALTMLLAPSKANAQVVEEGNVLVDAYYGFPNLYTAVFKGIYANVGSNYKVGSLGPVGIRGEFLLTDKVGLGLDLGLNSTTISYEEVVSEYNSNTFSYTNNTYSYSFKTQKVGAIVTFNYHFIENDALDAYFVVGMGYGNRSFTFESTEPGYVNSASINSVIPVASKIGVGLRYFFTDNIGANLALGLGQGGLINAGISAKF